MEWNIILVEEFPKQTLQTIFVYSLAWKSHMAEIVASKFKNTDIVIWSSR